MYVHCTTLYVAGQFHALIQYPDTLTATTAKAVSEGVKVNVNSTFTCVKI